MKLTEEQQKFAEENLPLAYYFANLHKRQNPWMDYEEVVDRCINALIATSRSYNETKATFATLMGVACRNQMIKYIRDSHNPKRKAKILSLDFVVNPEKQTPFDVFLGEEDRYTFETTDHLKSASNVLTAQEKEVLYRTYYLEETQRDIGLAMGYAQPHIGRLLKRALSKMKESLEVMI